MFTWPDYIHEPSIPEIKPSTVTYDFIRSGSCPSTSTALAKTSKICETDVLAIGDPAGRDMILVSSTSTSVELFRWTRIRCDRPSV
jgi:hypothetical protein